MRELRASNTSVLRPLLISPGSGYRVDGLLHNSGYDVRRGSLGPDWVSLDWAGIQVSLFVRLRHWGRWIRKERENGERFHIIAVSLVAADNFPTDASPSLRHARLSRCSRALTLLQSAGSMLFSPGSRMQAKAARPM